jgi:thiol-disulfide isomerase/thioredoxin
LTLRLGWAKLGEAMTFQVLEWAMKRRKAVLVVTLLMAGGLVALGDVIYLRNGSVLVVEKAWEEAGQVKYQTASGVQTMPLDSVKRIQSQEASPADPSRHQSVRAVVIRGQGPASAPPATTKPASKSSAPDSRASARSSRYQDAVGYAAAMREHEATGKPVALYFYTDWCKFCARLERGTLSHSEVKQYLNTILYVSVNPDHGRAEEALFREFEGRGYPTFLVLAKNQSAQEIPTSASPEAFLRSCREAARGGNQ